MSFLFFLILLVWIVILQQKVDNIAKSVDFINKNLNRFYQPEHEEIPKKAEVESPKIEVELSTTEAEQPVASVEPEPPQEIVKPEQVFIKEEVRKDDFDLQNAFLGNIFNKIGALAIIIAVIIFAKLVSPFIVITPVMKLVLGFLAGFGMVCGALYMHQIEKFKNYSEVLLGTGFAVLFTTTFCGYSLFHIFNPVTAVSVGGLLLLATYIIADRMKTVSMLVIGLIGGYLTPVFAGTSYEDSMWYLIFLNIVSLAFTLKNPRYNCINIINLLITMFAFIPYVIEPNNPLYPVVLWGIYIIYDLLRNKECSLDSALGVINYVVLTIFTVLIFKNAHTQLGYLFATTAFVYLLLALASRFILKNEQYKNYEYYILMNIWLFVLFILNDVNSVITWSLGGLLLAVAASVLNQQHLNKCVVGYLSTAFAGALLVHDGGSFALMKQYEPILNLRTLVFAVPVVSMFFSGLLIKAKRNLFNFGALSLIYIYAVGEINSLIMKYTDSSNLINFNKYMIYTILGFIYTLQTKRLYISNKYMLFNIASFIIGFVSVIMLLCGSYSYPSGYLPVLNLRFAAYTIAIVSGVVFARWTKYDFYKYLAVILGFFLAHSESVGIHRLHEGMQYVISLAWVLYSGGVTVWGILSNRRYLINSGIFLIILAILRIFIYDLAHVDALYKLIAFLALGIILMFVSYIYTSVKKKN